MLTIFICEDNPRYLNLITKCVEEYIDFEDFDIEMGLSTSDPDKIIKLIKQHKVNGLYFLDIELEGGHNGVKVAEIIHQHDPRGFVVFITAHPRYMSLTFEYKVETLAYIHKDSDDIIKQKVCDCIKNAYSKHVSRSNTGNFIFTEPGRQKISCEFEDILFFETASQGSKQVILHTKKRQYVFYASLDEIAKLLPIGMFYKCHKSYVINMCQLSAENKLDLENGCDRITMPNANECLISKRKKYSLLKILETTVFDRQIIFNSNPGGSISLQALGG